MKVRLNKAIASNFHFSRRKADNLIANNKVYVNKVLINQLGTIVNIGDLITINNKTVKIKNQKHIYLIFNKPKSCLTTKEDIYKRKTIYDILPAKYHHLKYAGRLDYNTSGLLILTSDGDFINEIIHPNKDIYKTYIVTLNKNYSLKDLEYIKKGVKIDHNYKTKPCLIEPVNSNKLRISIKEGKNRQIKKMFKVYNYQIVKLKRIAIGNLNLHNLQPGKVQIFNKKDLFETIFL